MMICWEENKTGEIIWKYPKNKIFWGNKIFVGSDQVAGIFSGFKLFSHPKLHGIFHEGENLILPENIPSVLSEFPKNKIMKYFNGTIIFCSTNEFDFSGEVEERIWCIDYTICVTANVQCKLQVSNGELFLRKFVGEKEKKSNKDFINYLKKILGKAIVDKDSDKLNVELKSFGIQLLNFQFNSLKEKSYSGYGGG